MHVPKRERAKRNRAQTRRFDKLLRGQDAQRRSSRRGLARVQLPLRRVDQAIRVGARERQANHARLASRLTASWQATRRGRLQS